MIDIQGEGCPPGEGRDAESALAIDLGGGGEPAGPDGAGGVCERHGEPDLSLVETLVHHFTGNGADDWSRGLEALTRAVGGRAAVLGLEGDDDLPIVLATYGPVDAVTRNRDVASAVKRAKEQATSRLIRAFRTEGEPHLDFAVIVKPGKDLLGLALWEATSPPDAVHVLLRSAVFLVHRLLAPAKSASWGGEALRDPGQLEFPPGYVPGTSPGMVEVYKELAAVAPSELSVLLVGETGTGKDLLARTIHQSSRRASRPFVAINCAAIPDTLLEAELFGVERRVATGVDPREGRLEQADGGSLFLDEIGEMAPALQVKLLRVLQEREVQPLGGRARPIDVRVIAATNADLDRRMAEGGFRRDLYYRLAGIEVAVPPLRSRRGDVPQLVRHFLERSLAESDRRIRGVSLRAMELLVGYSWPGNIRELEHELRRLVFVCPRGGVIESTHLRDPFLVEAVESPERLAARLETGSFDLKEYLDGIEREILREALARSGGNQTRAAELLSLSRNGLAKKLQRFGIDPADGVKG